VIERREKKGKKNPRKRERREYGPAPTSKGGISRRKRNRAKKGGWRPPAKRRGSKRDCEERPCLLSRKIDSESEEKENCRLRKNKITPPRGEKREKRQTLEKKIETPLCGEEPSGWNR